MRDLPFDARSPHRAALQRAVDRLRSLDREARRIEAERLSVLAEIDQLATAEAERFATDSRSEAMPRRAAAIEAGYTLATSDRAAAGLLAHAASLIADYPSVHTAMTAGAIAGGHAHAILHHGTDVADDRARTAYTREILEIAMHETVGRTWHLAKILAHKYADATRADRQADALARRGTTLTPLDDGVAEYRVIMDAAYALAIDDRVRRQARLVQDAERAALAAARRTGADGDLPLVRPLAQIRADIATNLLLNGTPANTDEHGVTGHAEGTIDLAGIRARIQVTVPVLTLIPDHDHEPRRDLKTAGLQGAATLAGYGPIHPTTARLLTDLQSGWDRISCHPTTGQVLTVDRYRPSAEITRFVVARDQHCRAPGCTVPAHRGDLDHTVDAAHGGPTSTDNLTALCRHHHTNKHHAGIRMRLDPDGEIRWTTPLGTVIHDRPTSRTVHRPRDDGSDTGPPGPGARRQSRVKFRRHPRDTDDTRHPF